MKKFIPAVLATLALSFSFAASAQYKDGTYTGKAPGKEGDVEVSVSIEGGKITNAEVTQHEDTEALMMGVIDNVVPELIETQDPDKVDAVTGATLSSQGVINAVKQALEQAKN
ncbi:MULTISPECIES: FMN-binding protein [unclassified Brenneria]|uniref:FMN-binding protein n=1 Tax=unclassified Brenneria TaxID=2634434 RepID=UPI001554AE63|nr:MULTISPECIES: FMN-binding protein [unclassified Brenneria]MBJ7221205.1 FMN-binding protein [Brenneria sp. L3-3C-1]MEE3642448.1 FMN-binding protein [Brenneria sp. L3_3C_1]MEE3650188.1 FMN-binding protein [Brenneria sp. HEZEL_4_2_4]NPD00146.1 FMN-binding protein [Brenneria sp. hezel4-2-4]